MYFYFSVVRKQSKKYLQFAVFTTLQPPLLTSSLSFLFWKCRSCLVEANAVYILKIGLLDLEISRGVNSPPATNIGVARSLPLIGSWLPQGRLRVKGDLKYYQGFSNISELFSVTRRRRCLKPPSDVIHLKIVYNLPMVAPHSWSVCQQALLAAGHKYLHKYLHNPIVFTLASDISRLPISAPRCQLVPVWPLQHTVRNVDNLNFSLEYL